MFCGFSSELRPKSGSMIAKPGRFPDFASAKNCAIGTHAGMVADRIAEETGSWSGGSWSSSSATGCGGRPGGRRSSLPERAGGSPARCHQPCQPRWPPAGSGGSAASGQAPGRTSGRPAGRWRPASRPTAGPRRSNSPSRPDRSPTLRTRRCGRHRTGYGPAPTPGTAYRTAGTWSASERHAAYRRRGRDLPPSAGHRGRS